MATDLQVQHYQALARGAQALSAGYDDWLTRDDPANAVDPLDDPRAEQLADEYWTTPELLLDGLARAIPGADYDKPVNTAAILRAAVRTGVYDPAALTTAQLLAMLLNATKPEHIVATQVTLRDRLEPVLTEQIEAAVLRGKS